MIHYPLHVAPWPPPLVAVAVAVSMLALSGCPGVEDFCRPAEGSRATLFVQPDDSPERDTTNQYGFHKIQDALDSADGRPTTVCVAAGVYYESLSVPPNITLRGAGINQVRVRPAQVRIDWPPEVSERTLLTLLPDADGDVVVEGMDFGDAGICVDAVGTGTSTLRNVRLVGCAVGIRGSEGTLILEGTFVRSNTLWGVRADGMDSLQLTANTELRGNGWNWTSEGVPDLVFRAELLDGIEDGGAIRVSGVDELIIDHSTIARSSFNRAAVVANQTPITLLDSTVVVDRLGEAPGGQLAAAASEGPVFRMEGGSLTLERTSVQTEGHALLDALVEPIDVVLRSSSWNASDRPSAWAGDPSPALWLRFGGTLLGTHVSFWGPGDGPAVAAGDNIELSVTNSILWGHGDSVAVNLQAFAQQSGPGFRFSLLEDPQPQGAGQGLVPPQDPLFAPRGSRLSVLPESPARCAGDPAATHSPDLVGNPRPFEAGKAPDLGAVELQEACPI